MDAPGLFGCCSHPKNAVYTAFCLPCAYGEVHAAATGEEKPCVSGKCILYAILGMIPYVSCYVMSVTRNRVNQQAMVEPTNYLVQCFQFCFCIPCIICQMRAIYDNSHPNKEPHLMTF
ncbi:hypothetical protein FVE85_5001 [Porphyridium purpureum]|uniref:Uncharacterized protein n=1 Tax=Porphyridium purpureum TaxID=35688 RepID=A0A5J4YSY6_PORPP|nr:hypothetical protein FVE85_5001 [Porphyridium purpureum]|eukprot:POR2389..scf236_6